MKRISLFWIIWIFATLESKDVACVSYPGVYRNELPVIVPGASPIETVFVTERYGINYECIETCYPILNLCDDKCSVMPDLPECAQCQRLPAAQPTPIIIETPPYEPIPPTFERPVTPIVYNPPPIPRPPLFPRPNPPRRPMFPSPPRPMLPEIPRPPPIDGMELVPPTPILPDIPQPPEPEILQPELPVLPDLPELPDLTDLPPVPPEIENYETERPPQVPVPDVPHPDIFEHFPPQPILPPQFEIELPPLPNLTKPPPVELSFPEIPLPPEPLLPEVPLISQFEEFPPQPMLPDSEIYSQVHLFEPPLSYVPMHPEFPISEVPLITIYEPPQIPVMQPILPEIVRIPSPVSPEQTIIVTSYPENVVYPEPMQVPEINSEIAGIVEEKDIIQPPIATEYQDICNDYCLVKRNISECEICLRTGVPPHHLELCSNCLVNPSEPDCELCYPILFNLCREFCIFEENEPDCSMCYPQPFIEVPVILTENVPEPFLPTPMEFCPEYCVLTPASPECVGCGMGIEVIEKVCIDICAGYCLDNPNDKQCAVCYTEDIPDIVGNHEVVLEEWPTLEVINYQCCYGDYCTPMPRSGICPVVCKEQCTTACSDDCFNPTCPDCQEIVALNEYRRTQFMIWLKSKLSDMKSRYMAMIEACIRRTELMYERELQAIEMEVDTSLQLA